MIRKALALVIAVIIGAQSIFAQYEPQNVRNNLYYLESVRLAGLAQSAFDEGDYDASAEYAREAIRYAQLSDEYAALQLKIKETNDAIAAAKQRLDWSVSSGASKQFPGEYSEAVIYYNQSLSSRSAQQWDDAIIAANKVVQLLAYITPAQPGTGGTGSQGMYPLPAQYTVRTWTAFRDCLWIIAGYPWVYGDPFQWRRLYEANKSKMPEPDNPNLIEPGMVLDIPSIKGEFRQGMWDSSRAYNLDR